MRFVLMALLASPAALLASCGSVSSTEADAAATPDVPVGIIDSAPPADQGPPDNISGLPDVVTPPDAPPGAPDASTCLHCADLAMGGDFTLGCPASIDLYTAVIDCICLPASCGMTGCMTECSGGSPPDPTPCQDCIMMVISPGGVCEPQATECFADM
jgi:hypothetical protein